VVTAVEDFVADLVIAEAVGAVTEEATAETAVGVVVGAIAEADEDVAVGMATRANGFP
jgi:hypothetical protein